MNRIANKFLGTKKNVKGNLQTNFSRFTLIIILYSFVCSFLFIIKITFYQFLLSLIVCVGVGVFVYVYVCVCVCLCGTFVKLIYRSDSTVDYTLVETLQKTTLELQLAVSCFVFSSSSSSSSCCCCFPICKHYICYVFKYITFILMCCVCVCVHVYV